ncbi:glycosyltransferase family 4 protein [Flavobacterium sp.]|uniref:glycosyltransferase family 4 protein n=1 Tax=Flavobacterium sp. TaxID=239 RepID=UPI00286DCF5E|nr:glycosyltransferase family 4 protein [Flavobacterium sp.]
MHICFITNEYPKTGFPHGGIGSFVKTISQELVENGVKVSVVGINYANNYEEYSEDGIDIYRLKKSNVKGLAWYFNSKEIQKKIKEIHNKNAIDIVETSELGLAFIKKNKAIKYLIRLHGGHHFFAESENRSINKWKGFQEKRSFIKADAFVAVSHYVKSHTEKYLSYHNKRVERINYPINTNLFKSLNAKVIPNKIVFAGTVCEKKGVRQLIQAFPKVIQAFPNATLDIYGRDWFFPDGSSYIEMLKDTELTKINEVSESICFKGIIPYEQIPLKYAEAQVCVFPSHMETQGLVAPEAMAMEKMVIFTKLGPGPETIVDYETGLLCNPKDSNDIAEKIIWVFQNQEKVSQIEKKAREFVMGKYDLKKIVQKNIEFYQSIL